MKKISILFFLFSLICFTSLAQKDDKKKDDKEELSLAKSSAKMIAAKHEYNNENMRGALTLFREVMKAEPDNASARYWTAKCHYALKKYKLAEKYLLKSIAIDSKNHNDIELFLGMIEHRLANTDEAIKHYKKYINITNNKSQIEETRNYIRQCKFAALMMSQPADVEVKNIGEEINSRFDDYTPSITSDGKLLIFTSRRSSTKGGEIDEKSDYKFFEDIFYSEWNEETQEWSRARGLEGDVNTTSYDAVLSIAPSGDYIYIYKNDKEFQGDIFLSNYLPDSQQWSTPERLPRPINTSYYESSISITSDGKTIYFVSERQGGEGRGDIYVSNKTGENSWSSPKNIGDIINTDEDEKFVFIHPNGKTLYFASEGHQSMGSYDIFKTEFVNGNWSLPVNLGYPINTVNEESTFSLTMDNKKLLIAAEYENTFGERDIYTIDVSNYELLAKGYGESSYGTVTFVVENKKGNSVKGAEVQIYYSDYDEVIYTIKTDKNGVAVTNLPLNRSYKIKVLGSRSFKEDEFDLIKAESGETKLTRKIKF